MRHGAAAAGDGRRGAAAAGVGLALALALFAACGGAQNAPPGDVSAAGDGGDVGLGDQPGGELDGLPQRDEPARPEAVDDPGPRDGPAADLDGAAADDVARDATPPPSDGRTGDGPPADAGCPECCATDGDCDDGNPCTTDACSAPGGRCTHTPLTDCCTADAECGDADPCTVDYCRARHCLHDRAAGCCRGHADCADGDPCTAERCPALGAACTYEPVANCCRAAADCIDADPCTADLCEAPGCWRAPGCCATDLDCLSADPCAVGRCAAGRCRYTPDPAAPVCCAPETVIADFESGTAPGFTFSPPAPSGDGFFIVTAAPGASVPGGQFALHFGGVRGGDYHDGAAATALGPPVALVPDRAATLRFFLRSDTAGPGDVLHVAVEAAGQTFGLGEFAGRGDWHAVELDLTFLAGLAVRPRFEFRADDGGTARGVWLDDIVLRDTCAPRPCTVAGDCTAPLGCVDATCRDGGCEYALSSDCCAADSDCADADPCTSDTCTAERCQHLPVAGCCNDDAACADADPCTLDRCVDNACVHPCAPDCAACCLTAADCADGDPCTLGDCTAGRCTYTAACCAADSDCTDADPCTRDRCEAGFCVLQRDPAAPGCCEAEPLGSDFEDGTLGPFVASGSGPSGWRVVTGGADESRFAAYFGRADTSGYDDGSSGSLTSEPLDLLAGLSYSLTFFVRVDTEAALDALHVEALVGSQVVRLGSWSGSSAGFEPVVLDLGPLAGSRPRLRFAFAADASVAGGGVWLDAVRLTTSCAAPPCATLSDCAPPGACLTPRCEAGRCRYERAPEPCCGLPAVLCDDTNPCTEDGCADGTCRFLADPLLPNCCTLDGQCSDDNPCTTEACVDNTCVFACTAVCPAPLPHVQAFESLALESLCWHSETAAGPGTSNWRIEAWPSDGMDGRYLHFGYAPPAFAFVHCAVSPALDLTSATAVSLAFDHNFADFGGVAGALAAFARVSPDDGASWVTLWRHEETLGSSVGHVVVAATAELAGAAAARLAFCVAGGDASGLDGFSVDNVTLSGLATGGP